jgi:hypothetical protein
MSKYRTPKQLSTLLYYTGNLYRAKSIEKNMKSAFYIWR